MTKHKSSFCENIGKVCIASLTAYLFFTIIRLYMQKNDYLCRQEKLRQAYEGLSPEEY
jgi:hypothetical protein